MEPKDKDISGEEHHGFNEPRTIPAGWDVSAFFTPEQDNLRNYGMVSDSTQITSLPQELYEHT